MLRNRNSFIVHENIDGFIVSSVISDLEEVVKVVTAEVLEMFETESLGGNIVFVVVVVEFIRETNLLDIFIQDILLTDKRSLIVIRVNTVAFRVLYVSVFS